MKILTWNLGFWQHRTHHDEAWAYLQDCLNPDLALLQEVKPPPSIDNEKFIFQEITHGWGTAIYAPDIYLTAIPISQYSARVVAARAQVNPNLNLFIASIHAPIINGRVFPHLSNIMNQLEILFESESALIGGDLNSARLAEKVWPGYGHKPFFERIDKGDPLVDCCRKFHTTEIQTFFRDGCLNPFQDDHLFVTQDLADYVTACDVVQNEVTRKVSDHIPLLLELDVPIG